MNHDLTHRDSARAADELARARRRPVTRMPAPRMKDLIAKKPVTDAIAAGMARENVPGRVVSPEEHACMDAIERACETDNEGGR